MRTISLLFIMVMVSTLLNAQGISVSPSRIFFKGAPGETVSHTITLSNHSNANFNFVATIKDWDRDSLGVKQYYPVSSLKFSNGSWLRLSATNVQLAPNETKNVVVSMQIPESNVSKELSASMLFFTQVNEQKTTNVTSGLGIQVLFEIGIQVYHVPEGLDPGELEFSAFEDLGKVLKSPDSVRTMAVKIKNTGKINKDAQLKFELTNTLSGEEIPIKSTSLALLPNSEQWVYIDLPSNLKGTFLAVAILDAGETYALKIAEKNVTY